MSQCGDLKKTSLLTEGDLWQKQAQGGPPSAMTGGWRERKEKRRAQDNKYQTGQRQILESPNSVDYVLNNNFCIWSILLPVRNEWLAHICSALLATFGLWWQGWLGVSLASSAKPQVQVLSAECLMHCDILSTSDPINICQLCNWATAKSGPVRTKWFCCQGWVWHCVYHKSYNL